MKKVKTVLLKLIDNFNWGEEEQRYYNRVKIIGIVFGLATDNNDIHKLLKGTIGYKTNLMGYEDFTIDYDFNQLIEVADITEVMSWDDVYCVVNINHARKKVDLQTLEEHLV